MSNEEEKRRQVHDAAEKAKWLIARDLPYFARLSLRLATVISEKVPLAAIDQQARLYVNPERFLALGKQERAAVVLHELLHLALRHFDRAKRLGIDETASFRWNYAADLEVNQLVSLVYRLPPDPPLPQNHGLQPGEPAESYFPQLEVSGNGPAGSSIADGLPKPWEEGGEGVPVGLPDFQIDNAIKDAARAFLEDSAQNQYASLSSSGLLRSWALKEIKQPVNNWRQLLKRLAAESVQEQSWQQVDYSYRKPRQRGALLFPRLRSPAPRVALVIDTSGSMEQNDFHRLLAEVKGILEVVGEVEYYAVDAEVNVSGKATSLTDIKLRGGGGTFMEAGIDAAVADGHRTIIVLTDGGTPWPEKPKRGEKVIAVLTSRYWQNVPGWIEPVFACDDWR